MPDKTPKPKKTKAAKTATTDVVQQDENVSVDELTAHKINRLFTEGREDTVRERLNYWLNYAFWRGAQWVWIPKGYVSEAQIDVIPGSAKKNRERATLNRIQPNMNNSIARAMKTSITLEVLPEAADDIAHQGALKGESILRQKALDENWEVLKENLMTAGMLGGVAGLATLWNPDAHRYNDEVSTGDAELTAMSIEDFVVEPGSVDGPTARWWIHKQVLPAAAVQATFQLKDKPKEDGESGGPFSSKALEFSSVLGQKKGTQVITYYERPNHLRPAGAVAVVVGTEIVAGPFEWPYPFTDHLNLDVLTCIADPERWTGESPVTQAISPQRQYNQLWTKIHETTHRTVGSKLILDSRHAELNKQLDDDPETPIKLSPAADARDPHFLAPPQLAPYVVQQIEELRSAVDDAMNVHAISRGEAGVNAPDSGYGLSIIAENDATPIGRLLKEVARVFANASTNILKLYADKVTDTRTAIVNDGGMARAEKWTGKDLAGQTRAIVPADSVLPRSEAGMLKMATDLLQMKPDWFSSFSQWAAMASVPGVHDMTTVMDDDLASAEWENGRLGQNEMVEVQDFDDHAKHIQQHNHFRKSPKYRMLPEKTRKQFDLHVAAHKGAAAHEAGVKAAEASAHQALAGIPSANGAPALAPPTNAATSLAPSGAEPFVPQVPEGAQ